MLTENIFENISEQSNVMIAAELNLEKKKTREASKFCNSK